MPAVPRRISTGVSGLDKILGGGFIDNRMYLVEGGPGAGKTTLALQFLLNGRAEGERGLYVTLSETADELHVVAESHGWSLDGIEMFELESAEQMLDPANTTTLLHPWEVELGETVRLILEQVERVKPSRVVFDSLSELRLLAQDPLRYRRQILAVKQYFNRRSMTLLMLDDYAPVRIEGSQQLHSLCHGVISLERKSRQYGATRRRLEVMKSRAAAFHEGWHDFDITRGGIEVYPRLVASDHYTAFNATHLSSGVPELDAMLNGGPMRGTNVLISGPSGAGKTTMALQYVAAAAARGERCAIYEFDERAGTVLARAAACGISIDQHLEGGNALLRQIDPAEVAPGAFAAMVRAAVDAGVRVVVIDSLNGYLTSMPQEDQLLLQVHELLFYLAQKGVTTFLINPQEGVIGAMSTAQTVSYVADTVFLLRFFEAGGHIRKAIAVVKNRGGPHENTIREMSIGQGGVRLGPPLMQFEGVMTGTPTYIGRDNPWLADEPAGAVAAPGVSA